MKRLKGDEFLVIGTDNAPKGQFQAYLCDNAAQADDKEADLKSRGLPNVRRGTVRDILGK